MNKKFSLNLAVRKICRQRGLSIHQFALKCGDKQRAVYQNINRDSPSIATCERYADALGVSLVQLVSEGYVKPPSENNEELPC
ncbi:helix-turn-helix domain-containing protein [Pantoea agglomerans]|uniref:helix-turn-helix domain-containing protein n=1 Tax=Enterobacter agglomerans TaxID=549 RepID=UPI002413BA93|nr:helix-turn-helix transcriptional regulator [Pantoea agglomerans]